MIVETERGTNMKIKFTTNGGYDIEQKHAKELLTIGEEYEVVGGTVG